ncbi:hypothetical protein A3D80_02960 [Candidatus Roizmanbacteria bacterium RIFCSPHIGHO2_02_FULL_40_13b]|uniref:PrsW family intramembrane metalloprotease n=1 Tax=Candidatus Roizmanbacteria bacterium RIFCSPHIGHO2_01_FULL_39_24 TaxID=1802032 RepID=A0A1F7GJ25_9BACT|nr:MAG: hypothetical protein A2799_02080 [Candidatus Roizmanbacteria bacterium RIFCSPHIGHO2_01_FULL_39_24]OGK27152.1 MAG: hypothetical protein A3D80_02960 [Candidatus Roizmanbacteria bacterium RIFCSPHIGHO2_02_FULL_40_13b]OGK49440.1 MAG: hypothetical protein A3A56_00095 [Candidatus Roizmanbacteria bacterium RIFCSPLOWO2_01_FULL_40_32]OGK57054.1 MAG: hypothetical protein A3H83_03645 [Candidatus Roizmanbacteria bacterium RIFCSPLOWO2_02_FULL_39_8]
MKENQKRMYIFTAVFAAIAPFILWPIEIFFPYPHIVEELAKALLIFFILKSGDNRQKIYATILIGFLFGITENFLYLFSPATSQTHLFRFMVTMPLHITTSLAILIPALLDKRLLFLGIVLAGLLHYFYNTSVSLLVF